MFCLGLGIAEITRALKNSFRSFGSVLTSVILNSQLLHANTMNGDLLGGDKLVYEGCRDVSDMYNSCST